MLGRARSVSFVALVGALAALGFAGQAAAGGPGKWTTVTGADANTVRVGFARAPDGNLHVAYRQREQPGAGYSLRYTRLSSSGQTLAERVLQTGWPSVNPSVDVVYLRGTDTLAVYFAGVRNAVPNDPYDGRLAALLGSPTGDTWVLTEGALSNSTASGASGIGAGADPRASGVIRAGAWGDSGFNTNGISFANAIQLFEPYTLKAPSLAGTGYPEVVADSKGNFYAAWQQIAGKKGIYVRRVTIGGPSGPERYAPGSSLRKRTRFRLQQQRTAIAARKNKPGAWLAYGKGYPTTRRILLWRVGAKRAKTLVAGKRAKGAKHISIATGPSGRLWVFWQRGGRYFAARTNPKATKLGRIKAIKPPAKTQSTYSLLGEGSRGRLDLFAHVRRPNGTYTMHTQVRP
jgi:hypothetical protein